MDSKVDFLLRNHPIEYVVQVQQKIKNDVEHKKDELRTLISDRYNELLDATKSIDDMKSSVDVVIESLKDLNKHLQNSELANEQQQQLTTKFDDESHLSDILMDLPMRIWNLLYYGDVSEATFCYFVGNNVYKLLQRRESRVVRTQMHVYNQMTLEDMNANIVMKSWALISEKLKCVSCSIDDIGSILLSLMILQKIQISELSNEFYRRQTLSIVRTVQHADSSEYVNILNIVHNTVRCSALFDSSSEASLQKLFDVLLRTITTTQFENEPDELQQYLKFSYDNHFKDCGYSIDFTVTNNAIDSWFNSVKATIANSLKKAHRNVSSIQQLHEQIVHTERVLVQESRFQDWREIDSFDIAASIWVGCIKRTFEERVFEIFDTRTQELVTNIRTRLSSAQREMGQADVGIAESTWKEFNTKPNRASQLSMEIFKILDQGFCSINEEISILQPSFSNILVELCERSFKFIEQIKHEISRFVDVKEFSFFGAIFFRGLEQESPSLCRFFHLVPNSAVFHQFQQQNRNFTAEFYSDWFEYRLAILFKNFSTNCYSDLDIFLENLSVWDTISIQSEDSQQSFLEIPLHLSLSTYTLLQQISSEINRFSVYSLPKQVLISVFSFLGNHLLKIAQDSVDSLNSSLLPAAIKQTMALQLYFDLLFLKTLYASSKNESLQKTTFTTINEQLVALEAFVDPFDLHLMLPNMKINVDKLHRSSLMIFSFLRPEKVVKAPNKDGTTESTLINTMWLHSCSDDLLC